MVQVAERAPSRPPPPAEGTGQGKEGGEIGSSRRRILLVEDHPGDALLAKRALAEHPSFVLERVERLAEARQAIRDGAYEAVLLDLNLPDGRRLEPLLRVQEQDPDLPIVTLTGLDDEELARSCIDAGAQDYVRKSELSAVVLPRVLEHAIARHRTTKLSRRLEIAEQHASLGRISASVAHEINNQAAGALAAAEHASEIARRLRGYVDPGGTALARELHTTQADVIASLGHVAGFVSELESLGKLAEDSIVPIDVNETMRRVVRMLENRLRHVARVSLQLGDVPAALASERKLTQVFVNLLVNAADAIEAGGSGHDQIEVRTEARAGGRLAVTVADTGAGMDEAIRSQLFEPFFTSKPPGRGTGLGLSVCRDIVSKLGGRIDVESEPDRGTTFTVLLPIAQRGEAEATSAPNEEASEPARILLIDDEGVVRRALARLLRLTHEVELASGGAAARDLLAADPDYDVILCDLMMPDVDGPDVAEALAERQPELLERLIFLSGGAFTERMRRFVEASDYPILEKPATRERLLAAIEAVRRGRGERS